MFGIQSFVAVINPPQAAILAVGAMAPAPVVRDGEVVVRNIMRSRSPATTGSSTAPTPPFLGRIRERLENPTAARALGTPANRELPLGKERCARVAASSRSRR